MSFPLRRGSESDRGPGLGTGCSCSRCRSRCRPRRQGGWVWKAGLRWEPGKQQLSVRGTQGGGTSWPTRWPRSGRSLVKYFGAGRGREQLPLEPLLEEFSNLQPADGFESPAVPEAPRLRWFSPSPPPSPTPGWASLGTLCAKFSFEFPNSLNASSREH